MGRCFGHLICSAVRVQLDGLLTRSPQGVISVQISFRPAWHGSLTIVSKHVKRWGEFLIVIIPSLVSLISESGKRLAGTYPAVEVENDIRRRAHKIHELHGGNGCALEDWLEAEAEFFGINEAIWLERCFDSVAMKWRYLFRRLLNTML